VSKNSSATVKSLPDAAKEQDLPEGTLQGPNDLKNPVTGYAEEIRYGYAQSREKID
jgi:hypothetical protein